MKVCRPQKQPMSISVKRTALLLALLMSLICALPLPFVFGTVPFHNIDFGIYGMRCGRLKDGHPLVRTVYSVVAGLFVFVIVTSLIVIYGRIIGTVFRRLQVNKKDLRSNEKRSETTDRGENNPVVEDFKGIEMVNITDKTIKHSTALQTRTNITGHNIESAATKQRRTTNRRLTYKLTVPSQPFLGFWPYCGPTPVIVPQSSTPNLSVPADDFRQSISPELTSFSNRLGTLENIANKSNSPVISLRPDHDIGSDLEDSDEEERFSVAPGSQEERFTSDESSTNSNKEPEAEDAPSTLKDLRDSVFIIMRDVNKVPFQSPPRHKKLTSTFEASCGLSVDDTKSHTSFPQSNHMSNSLQIINDGIVAIVSSVSGFGLASFTEQFRFKDYDIFDSTLAVAPVLKDSSLPPEVKPFLLQVDKALGASQLLIMGSIANCTLSKRSEILDKAKVSDNLKDALIKSPLDVKIFGLPLDEIQKHLNQTPAPVKVNVSLSGNNSKRGSYSSAGGSSSNSQEKRRKITNDGGNKPKKSSIPRSKPNSFKRGGKRANPSS
ncbi:unnamed protein product [Mytilus edulis]|uniref:Uncharacterized protein n=1 Tax=Mytilus edulis TaxID=6550 RepID=A0A8S3RE05_MYTED|nr:unnamed protein product [Mytilus edulis]